MNYILEGCIEAFKLIFSFNGELYGIIFLSITVSYAASILSALVFVPAGAILGLCKFRHKKILSVLLYSFMGIPTVVVGLVVALIFARRGPLGFLQLMYTPYIMVIAQFVLVAPLITSLTYNLVLNRGKEIQRCGKTLGAGKLAVLFLIIRELRIDIFIIFITAFSRAITEIGAVMIVGGNIEGHTRVMTTSIAMFNSMGNYQTAIALGIIMIIISLINNIAISLYQERKAGVES